MSNAINATDDAVVVPVIPARITRPDDIKAGQTVSDECGNVYYAVTTFEVREHHGGEQPQPVIQLVALANLGPVRGRTPRGVAAEFGTEDGRLWVIAEVRS